MKTKGTCHTNSDEDTKYAEEKILNIAEYEHDISIYHHWWFTDYASDIAEYLYEREKLLPELNHQSPQISYRPNLINLICLVAEQKSLSVTCVHVAVFLLDIFMDNHNIAIERLNLVALVCLQLAAKIEERDVRVPKTTELNALISNQYPLRDYTSVEIMIMEFLSYNITIITSSHFLGYFTFLSVSKNDFEEIKNDKYTDYKHFKFIFHTTIFEFLDISLKDIDIVHTTPSLIASAIIYATREYLKLSLNWTLDLKLLTTYSLSEVEPYAQKLLQLRESLSKKRKLSPSSLNYKLENVPENTPKRLKEDRPNATKFVKPK